VQGRIEESIVEHRRAVELAPNNPWNNSNLLRDLTYSDSITPQELLAEHRAWWDRHGKPHAGEIQPHANDRNPDRKLRVGFLSPDFRAHSVAYFLDPIFSEHDREKFDFVCYAELARPDETSQRLQQLTEGWRSTIGVPDDAVVRQIREDKIDILIDLAGHTANTRIAVCARRPAPVQMTFLGYPFSTGLETVDYRITDALADPPGASEQWYVERLLRMPRTAWCYRPPAGTPAVVEAPVVANGFVTFGSFNNLAKLNSGHAATWSRILAAVPNSRLLLKSAGLGDEATHRRILEMFTAHGVDPSRLILSEYSSAIGDHLARYGEVDIGLDTFPYHGTTTTCEAMWMGVPVITLAGPIHLSRVGVSLLSNVGLPDLVAKDADDYLRIASALAGHVDRLRSLRASLRERMKNSPLCDAAGFTRSLEALLREAWQRWCASPKLD
jgi:predicted O-linked N-acetylglucosamine transferase (SPINDLY family)